MDTFRLLIERLNQKQIEAVLAGNGPLRIIAGAGTGKTTVLVSRVLSISRFGSLIPLQNILVLTFTNKAVLDMKQKLEEIAGEIAISDARIMTYHAFGFEVIRENARLLGFGDKRLRLIPDNQKAYLIESRLDDMAIHGLDYRNVDRVVDDLARYYALYKKRELYGVPEEMMLCEEDYREFPSFIREAPHLGEQLLQACRKLDDVFLSNGLVPYENQIILACRLFKEFPHILTQYQDRYSCLLVDEYQDTDEEQAWMVAKLAEKHRNITVVGDDDQSIYGFRNVHAQNLHHFERFFPEVQDVVLDRNYRSSDKILIAANRIIAHNKERIFKELQSGFEPGKWKDAPKPVLKDVKHNYGMKEYIAQQISMLVKKGISYGETAILCRSNQVKEEIYRYLVQQGIPAAMFGRADLLTMSSIQNVLAYAKLLQNPRDTMSLLQVLLMPKYRLKHQDVVELISLLKGFKGDAGDFFKPICDKEKDILVEAAVDYCRMKKLQETADFYELMEGICALGLEGGNLEEESDYRMLLSMVRRFTEDVQGTALPDLIRYIQLYGVFEEMPDDMVQTREDKVTVSTCHLAKGLEFTAVFIVKLQDFRAEKADERAVEEERRLLYVSMTRAKEYLHLLYWLGRESARSHYFVEEVRQAIAD